MCNEYVKPHRDALAAAIRLRHREMGSGVETVTVDDYESADAVLDLLPGRSEAEVQAEALREAKRAANHDWLAFQSVWGSSPSDLAVLAFANKALDWLHARADRLAAEGGADRG